MSQDNNGNGDAVSAPGMPCTDSDSDIEQMMQDDSFEPENDSRHPEAQVPIESDSEVPPAQTEDVDETSANDLLVLALNFSLEFGLSWKAVEALQKLIAHILDRHDIPASKYLFKKQLTVNELPPKMRHKNVVVSALWYGQSHPNMTLLLDSFVQQMRDLATGGVTWMAGTDIVHSEVYCLSYCADAPARASLQNFTQYNGYYGCGWCLHRGKTVHGTVKYPMDMNVKEERNAENTKRHMEKASFLHQVHKRVKGPSPLINLPYFDVIWGFTPDYMHCVLLGVSRHVTELWLSAVNEPYYIGSPQVLSIVDERLCTTKPHLCVSRLPRSLSVRKYWKASEWQQWLLYFSLPCLEGLLPAQFFKHFSLLVQGIALLLQDTVSKDNITTSTNCLVRFVVDVQFLYGEKHMTNNVHQLLHIPKSVVLQGPLWADSCFSFEFHIGHLKELVMSAKGVPIQIVERIMMASNYKRLSAQASPHTLQFLAKPSHYSNDAVLLVSKPRGVSEPLLSFVGKHLCNIIWCPVVEHDRVIVAGNMFHSEQYSRPNKTDSTAFVLF
ncbi:uncharacterized protein [Dermacentor andersoni]|uniref:uncharacterized protein n=1 Tax=Dermacentor andersoni TaxID=34620 RepID=UPI003B3AD674